MAPAEKDTSRSLSLNSLGRRAADKFLVGIVAALIMGAIGNGLLLWREQAIISVELRHLQEAVLELKNQFKELILLNSGNRRTGNGLSQ